MYPGKRFYDLTVTLLLLPLALPVVSLVSLALFILSAKNPIFRQKRPGYKEYPFVLYKIRTLYPVQYRAANKLGKILRTFSIDELPQLYNVLKGQMSVVGPRPLLMEYLPRYNAQQQRRHHTRPGITGWAQIHGRNKLDWSLRFELDLWYLHHQSLDLDIKITILSILRVFQISDVKPEGLKDEEKFMGNNKR